jgi:hypothetical protein
MYMYVVTSPQSLYHDIDNREGSPGDSFVLETDVVIIGGPRNGVVRHRREGSERAKVTQRTETARRSRHDGPSDD